MMPEQRFMFSFEVYRDTEFQDCTFRGASIASSSGFRMTATLV